ncbi:MAG TPA: hypothetical protein VFR23_03440 [Jiangellaceae bacterium]|nr:hypothetical protein [Jiangellaceae bacterium]
MGYVYQEFPRWLYKAGGDRLLVSTDAEKADALEDGWQLQPVVNGAAVVSPVSDLPKRRGRPPKARPLVSE